MLRPSSGLKIRSMPLWCRRSISFGTKDDRRTDPEYKTKVPPLSAVSGTGSNVNGRRDRAYLVPYAARITQKINQYVFQDY